MAQTTMHQSASGDIVRAPMLINGQWRFGAKEYDVLDPYRKEIVGKAPESTAADLDEALNSAVAAKDKAAAAPGYERAALIHRVVALLDDLVHRLQSVPRNLCG